VRPTYTEEARRRGLEGDVDLEVVVTENGRVSNVRVVRGLGGGLDARAVEAVRQWRFTPARRRGTAVAVIVQVSVAFSLR
jgi:TonB family protein